MGVFVGVKLIEQNQDTRRRAATDVLVDRHFYFNPSGSAVMSVGNTLTVRIMGNSLGTTLPGFVDSGIGVVNLRFRYDNSNLELVNGADDVKLFSRLNDIGTLVDNGTGTVTVLAYVPTGKSQITEEINNVNDPFISFTFRIKAVGQPFVRYESTYSENRLVGIVGGVTIEFAVVGSGGSVLETIYANPTQTPIPTATNTPIPTATLIPTSTPIPTNTPLLISTPTDVPSLTPTNTQIPVNTNTPVPTGSQCVATEGDYDGNGKIELVDLLGWYGDYKNNRYDIKSDFDCSGEVDISDLLVWYREYRLENL